jgi:ABC-type protease/lipase transport system fused ATPase/permease subunit
MKGSPAVSHVVQVSKPALREAAAQFRKQHDIMVLRVKFVSFVVGALLLFGALWYIGVLDRWIPGFTASDDKWLGAVALRLGSMVMVLFLVRIFIPLLRYAAELEIFYFSRSIALDLIGSSAIDGAGAEDKTVRIEIRAIVDLISAEKIELGPAPDSPVTELAAATKVAT